VEGGEKRRREWRGGREGRGKGGKEERKGRGLEPPHTCLATVLSSKDYII